MRPGLIYRILLASALLASLAVGARAQSTTQDFPTPVTSSEISGVIKPRDLGDSRLTTYYYVLTGEQGDLFLNLVTRNFTGDIDVFTANGLRPMTKIVVYADYGEAETGRAIYLRKAEKLLLRIQGRTPNDDEATFRLKFAGSFAAMRADDVPTAPEPPKVTAENRGGVRVNSVGTILPAPPKVEEKVAEKIEIPADPAAIAKTENREEAKPSDSPVRDEEPKRTEVIVSDPVKPETAPASRSSRRAAAARRRLPVRRPPPVKKEAEAPATDTTTAVTEKTETPAATASTPSFRTLSTRRRPTPSKKPVEPKPDPLESINLVVQFKDGTSLEKRMSDVFRFSVDKGVLTVVLKDRTVTRYPIADVARVTIE